jgi:hypothetical protein
VNCLIRKVIGFRSNEAMFDLPKAESPAFNSIAFDFLASQYDKSVLAR